MGGVVKNMGPKNIELKPMLNWGWRAKSHNTEICDSFEAEVESLLAKTDKKICQGKHLQGTNSKGVVFKRSS